MDQLVSYIIMFAFVVIVSPISIPISCIEKGPEYVVLFIVGLIIVIFSGLRFYKWWNPEKYEKKKQWCTTYKKTVGYMVLSVAAVYVSVVWYIYVVLRDGPHHGMESLGTALGILAAPFIFAPFVLVLWAVGKTIYHREITKDRADRRD